MEELLHKEVLKEKDAYKLVPLYANSFGMKVGVDYLLKKFFAEYQSITSSCVAYTQEGKAVSFYGILLQKASLNGQLIYIAQSCDSMTQPEFGGKGLFINLAELAYKTMKENGVNYIFGFPNERIYGLRIKKLQWQHTQNIHGYLLKTKTLPLAKVVKALPSFKHVYRLYLYTILKKYLSQHSFFENSILEKDVAGLVHDDSYFKYKSSSDKFIIKLQGLHFWIKVDGFLWVGDFENSTLEQFQKALVALKKIARLTGCTSIRFHYQEGTLNDTLLQQLFPINSTMPLGYICFSEELNPQSFKFCGADFDTW